MCDRELQRKGGEVVGSDSYVYACKSQKPGGVRWTRSRVNVCPTTTSRKKPRSYQLPLNYSLGVQCKLVSQPHKALTGMASTSSVMAATREIKKN